MRVEERGWKLPASAAEDQQGRESQRPAYPPECRSTPPAAGPCCQARSLPEDRLGKRGMRRASTRTLHRGESLLFERKGEPYVLPVAHLQQKRQGRQQCFSYFHQYSDS